MGVPTPPGRAAEPARTLLGPPRAASPPAGGVQTLTSPQAPAGGWAAKGKGACASACRPSPVPPRCTDTGAQRLLGHRPGTRAHPCARGGGCWDPPPSSASPWQPLPGFGQTQMPLKLLELSPTGGSAADGIAQGREASPEAAGVGQRQPACPAQAREGARKGSERPRAPVSPWAASQGPQTGPWVTSAVFSLQSPRLQT